MIQISNTSENRRQHLVLMHFNKNAKHSKSARSYRFFLFETLVKVKLKLKSIEPIEPSKNVKILQEPSRPYKNL